MLKLEENDLITLFCIIYFCDHYGYNAWPRKFITNERWSPTWILGIGFLTLLNSNPILVSIIKVIGTAYICWLSWKILFLNFQSTGGEQNEKAPNFLNGLLVHPLNPKGWAMVIAAYTQFTSFGNTYTSSSWVLEVIIVAGTFFFIQSISHSIWCWSGSLIFNFLSNKNVIRQAVVIILALLTIGTVVYSNFFI